MRAILIRKTRVSMNQSTLVTWEKKVEPALDGVSPLRSQEQEYRYPNGSIVAVGGMDKPSKVLSSEWDLAYIQEATELSEDEMETIDTRLRNGVKPLQQLVMDCNPDAPTHWLKQRCDAGRTVMLYSRHEDNPTVTLEYLASLDALTGVRYLRFRLGLWAAAEGMVYEEWDPAIHVVERFDIPRDWPRFWVVDFGYTNPFVWQAWAEDPDGRLFRYREIYMTKRLVEDHAKDILRWTAGEPRPRVIICDHDAEDRATLERHVGMSTTPAQKAVSPGLQAVAARLRPAGDGKPRIAYLKDSLVERDSALADVKAPTCTEEEYDSYIWDTSANRRKGEQPVKKFDHGLDGSRYMVADRDFGIAITDLDPAVADALAGFVGR